MPAGELVSVPVPVPVLETVNVRFCNVNIAVTEPAWLIVTWHVPVPAQPSPLHPVKSLPVAGVAVSVTTAAAGKGAEQVDPQSIPAGELVTVPEPLPVLDTVR